MPTYSLARTRHDPDPSSTVFGRIEGPILDRRGNRILQHFLESP